MPSFKIWLSKQFGEDLTITYGYQTKTSREQMKLPKHHWLDAYLIAYADISEIPELDWQNVPVLPSMQFRRHHLSCTARFLASARENSGNRFRKEGTSRSFALLVRKEE